jgi:hypothetical protein
VDGVSARDARTTIPDRVGAGVTTRAAAIPRWSAFERAAATTHIRAPCRNAAASAGDGLSRTGRGLILPAAERSWRGPATHCEAEISGTPTAVAKTVSTVARMFFVRTMFKAYLIGVEVYVGDRGV